MFWFSKEKQEKNISDDDELINLDFIDDLDEEQIDFDLLIKQATERAREQSKEYVDARVKEINNRLKQNHTPIENPPVASSVNEELPSSRIVDPTLKNEIIDEVVKVLTKEERLSAKLIVYEELLKKRALEYDDVLQKKMFLNQQKLNEQRHEIVVREREALIQTKCPACDTIPDSFGRCRCS